MNPMRNEVDRLRLALLEEYEQEGAVDIAEWVSKHPEYRDELLDYWIWVRGTTRLDELEKPPSPQDDIAESALRRAVEAVALGRGWLEESVPDPVDPDEVEKLGNALALIRRKPYEFGGTAGKPFRRAAVYSWIALLLGEQRGHVTRLATQKVAYLLERGLDLGLFTHYKPMPLGPYDSTAKYRDAEPIAADQEWLHIDDDDAVLRPGKDRSKAFKYGPRYVRRRDTARDMVRLLGQFSDDELETLATVDWMTCSLANKPEEITPDAIREALARGEKWRAKLDKPNFTVAAIGRALRWLKRLRLGKPDSGTS